MKLSVFVTNDFLLLLFCHNILRNVNDRLIQAYPKKTFGSFGFESIFTHLEIISNGSPIKVLNDRIDISKSNHITNQKFHMLNSNNADDEISQELQTQLPVDRDDVSSFFLIYPLLFM